jgi:hypothetical protein
LNPSQIELLVDRLLGAFPSTRIDAGKVKALWVRRPELLALDVSMAQTLIDALVWKQYFPTLAEVLNEVRAITTVQVLNDLCERCGGTRLVHTVNQHGDLVREPHPDNPDGPAVYVFAHRCPDCT